nr:MAG TPA: hypothetical protein [Caudoviricetes sp.]
MRTDCLTENFGAELHRWEVLCRKYRHSTS